VPSEKTRTGSSSTYAGDGEVWQQATPFMVLTCCGRRLLSFCAFPLSQQLAVLVACVASGSQADTHTNNTHIYSIYYIYTCIYICTVQSVSQSLRFSLSLSLSCARSLALSLARSLSLSFHYLYLFARHLQSHYHLQISSRPGCALPTPTQTHRFNT